MGSPLNALARAGAKVVLAPSASKAMSCGPIEPHVAWLSAYLAVLHVHASTEEILVDLACEEGRSVLIATLSTETTFRELHRDLPARLAKTVALPAEPAKTEDRSASSGRYRVGFAWGQGTVREADVWLGVKSGDGGALAVELHYDLHRIATAQAEALLDQVRIAFERSVANPELCVEEVELLSSAEIDRIDEWNRTNVVRVETRSIEGFFDEQARRTPHAPAVIYRGQGLTYDELRRRSDCLAAELMSRGAGPDALIALSVGRGWSLPVGVLGIVKSGAAYVPVDPNYPAHRIEFMLRDSRALLHLADTAAIALLPPLQSPRLNLDPWASPTFSAATCPESRQWPSDRLCYVIYTSGSTGEPKGVAMPHSPLVNLVDWHLRPEAKLTSAPRSLQYASPSFDVSFQEMFTTWAAGGCLIMPEEEDRLDPDRLWQLVERERISRVFLPGVALQQLAEAAVRRPSLPQGLQEVIVAGEQLRVTPAVAKMFESLSSAVLHNHYGPTETHVVTSWQSNGPPAGWPTLPPIGRPIQNSVIHLLNSARKRVPIGTVGEIWVGGMALARGYLHRPELTCQRFQPDLSGTGRMYRTGDLGRCQEDGSIEYLGRTDDQVKIRGFRVELGEIETALARHPAIQDAAVVVRETRAGVKDLVAFYIVKPGSIAVERELRAFLRLRLADFMLPTRFVRLDRFPLTPSGKVARRQLPLPETDSTPRVFSGSETEQRIARAWSTVLDRSDFGYEDNFFAVGGDSLRVIKLLGLLRESLGASLAVTQLFQFPTISGLARALQPDGSTTRQLDQARARALRQARVLAGRPRH